MSKYFDHTIYKFGTVKLVNKYDKYFLYIPVTYDMEESNISDLCNVVGIDREINFVIATYDSKHKSGFISGKAIKQKRANYSKLRKELQMRQTPLVRRRLKAIGQRENHWMQNVKQVSVVLYADILKRLIVTGRYICLLVKTVVINQRRFGKSLTMNNGGTIFLCKVCGRKGNLFLV